jgi:putative Mg2+ transporter-C (MgtC) family protein
MSLLHRLEAKLPGRTTLDIALTFRQGFQPKLDELDKRAEARGYRVLRDSLTITFADNQPLWKFGAVAVERSRAVSPALLAEELAASEGVASFSIAPVRN